MSQTVWYTIVGVFLLLVGATDIILSLLTGDRSLTTPELIVAGGCLLFGGHFISSTRTKAFLTGVKDSVGNFFTGKQGGTPTQ